MLTKFILFILLISQVYANHILKNTYYVNSNDIYISTLIENYSKDEVLYKIPPSRHTKKVTTTELLNRLKKHGYTDITTKGKYIKFIIKSPIDTSKIALYIKNYYLEKYDIINITKVEVLPRSYIASLPSQYSIYIQAKNYLSRRDIVSIKTLKNKKIFFNYNIYARLPIYVSKEKIKKNSELSSVNITKKSIILDKFMTKPLQNFKAHAFESKYNIKKDKIITLKNVQELSLVKKNSYITISLNKNNMSISFNALALDNGKLNSIIRVQKTNGKRLKVKVTGKNQAEIR
ncbi:flagellar basal body P-ring formation chaperone FlgA [Sulfurimonas sp.]|uniref:flagellar basal body P-ring formation chaperone FlgA n=1 Tax=Sulfurimonas sp. TaxID=2022749 RepID=UPI002B49181A|nr:flagellar basal body P-ring formation chaperone FlgA [Sulfurimonas sp.]